MKIYLATTTLTELTEITPNSPLLEPVRAYYVVTDEDQGSEYEVTLTYATDYDGVTEETLTLPFTTERDGKYYYSCTWKVLTAVGTEPEDVPSTDGYILLEYSATDFVSLGLWEIGSAGITVDWDGEEINYVTDDQGNYTDTRHTTQGPIVKTWNDSAPRTVRITGDLTWYDGSITVASNVNMTSATVSGMSSTQIEKPFYKCSSLTTLDIESASFSIYQNDGSHFFDGCEELETITLPDIVFSSMFSMSYMFYDCKKLKNLNESNLNFHPTDVGYPVVHHDMSSVFKRCLELTSLDLSHFNTDNLKYVHSAFQYCLALTSLNVSGWNMVTVEHFQSMFYGCRSLQSLDLSTWTTSSFKAMGGMFAECESLVTLDISTWDTSAVEPHTSQYSHPFSQVFNGCIALTNLDVSNWCVLGVVEPTSFAHLAPFANDPDNLPVWGTCGGIELGPDTTSDYILLEYSETDEVILPLTEIGPGGVTVDWDAGGDGEIETFTTASQGEKTRGWSDATTRTIKITGDLLHFGPINYTDAAGSNQHMTSAVVSGMSTITSTSQMFYYCTTLTSLDLSNFDTSNVTDMNYMFYNCSDLPTLNCSNFDTNNVTDMSYMFNSCTTLSALNVSSFDTSNVTNMQQMFQNNYYLTSLDLSSFDTGQVTRMNSMFQDCIRLTLLYISNFNTSSVVYMMNMFHDCNALTTLDLSDWCVTDITTEPTSFADDAPFADTASNLPVWGTCPTT